MKWTLPMLLFLMNCNLPKDPKEAVYNEPYLHDSLARMEGDMPNHELNGKEGIAFLNNLNQSGHDTVGLFNALLLKTKVVDHGSIRLYKCSCLNGGMCAQYFIELDSSGNSGNQIILLGEDLGELNRVQTFHYRISDSAIICNLQWELFNDEGIRKNNTSTAPISIKFCFDSIYSYKNWYAANMFWK